MIYFDNAATSYPKPQSVLLASQNAITKFGGNPGRSGHKMSLKASEKIYNIRKQISETFNCETENVVFTSNCTHSLNMAIKGVMLQGGHIITSCFEHNSVIRPIHALNKQGRVTYSVATVYENDIEKTIQSFEQLIKSETKAIVCTHASNVTGMVLPIKQIGELCKKHNIKFIVDAAQTAGVLNIDMKQNNINILCIAAHKGLYAISGTGLMLLNDIENVSTIIEGGTGSTSYDLNQPDFYPDRFESGTVNTVGILSMGAGVNFINSKGIDNIYKHEFDICKKVYSYLKSIKKVKLYINHFKYNQNVPVIPFNIEGHTSVELVEILSQKGFALRGGLHCSYLAHNHLGTLDDGVVRFAPSYFSKNNEVKLFLQTINNLCE